MGENKDTVEDYEGAPEQASAGAQSAGVVAMGCVLFLALGLCVLGGAGFYMYLAFQEERARLAEYQAREEMKAAEAEARAEREREERAALKAQQMQQLKARWQAEQLRKAQEAQQLQLEMKLKAEKLAEAAKKAQEKEDEAARKAREARQKELQAKRDAEMARAEPQKLMIQVLGANKRLAALPISGVSEAQRTALCDKVKARVAAFLTKKIEVKELGRLHEALIAVTNEGALNQPGLEKIESALNE